MNIKKLLLRGFVLGSLLLTVAPNPARAATTVSGTTSFTGIATTSATIFVLPPPTTVTTTTTLNAQMSGSFTVNETNVTVLANCSFSGTSTDNAATGNGLMAGTCSGTAVITPPGTTVTFSLSCTVKYTRVGTTFTVTATCTGAAGVTIPIHYCGNGAMQWVPTWTDGDEFIATGDLAMRPVPAGGCEL